LWIDHCHLWSRAQKKVVLGDGAEWIWNIADQHFPGAIQIVDLYHARQHLWELARKLFPNQQAEQARWMVVHSLNSQAGSVRPTIAANCGKGHLRSGFDDE
jgi:transposase